MWYGKLAEDVVYTHQQVPKKPGSNKLKTSTRSLHAFLKIRWLELSGEQLGVGPVFGWDDGGLDEPGFVDGGCPTASLLCEVELIKSTDEFWVDQYVMSESEHDRVTNLTTAPASDCESEGDSSSGIEDEFDTNVSQLQEHCYVLW